MFSKQLLDELGILNFKHKQAQQVSADPIKTTAENYGIETPKEPRNLSVPITEKQPEVTQQPKLDKSEFRLLVKMLQAIGHECVYDNMSFDGHSVAYELPNKTLIFNDINSPDNTNTINLCSLSDLITKPELKRPVWEKLKTI